MRSKGNSKERVGVIDPKVLIFLAALSIFSFHALEQKCAKSSDCRDAIWSFLVGTELADARS